MLPRRLAAQNLSPSPDSCHQGSLRRPVCFSLFSSTWGNPEVGGGYDLFGQVITVETAGQNIYLEADES